MEIDYKIKDLQISSQGIHATVVIYRGATTTENEEKVNEQTGELETVPVTRYRRIETIRTVQLHLDPTQLTNLFTRYVNKRVKQEAASRGATVISEQNSTTV